VVPPEPAPEPSPQPAAVADEESPAPERKKPAIGRQRRSAFDVISGDGDTGRKRRSAADILAAPLGGDATGPGRLRRTTDADGDAGATDVRPGGLRRSSTPPDEPPAADEG
jgi:arginase